MSDTQAPGSAPVKVLVVIGQLEIGGAEKHLARVLPAIARAGVDVSVCALRGGGPLEGALRAAGVRVISPATGRQGLGGLLAGTWLLARYAWSARPAVIHFFLPAAYLLGALATLGLPARRVMSRRSLAVYQGRYPGVGLIERFLHRRMDAVLGNSRAVTRELHREAVPGERLGLIYNGVALPRVAPDRVAVRARLGIPENSLAIVCVANLIPYKGHRDLLTALESVRDRLPANWTLLLVGRDDGIGAELRAQTHRAGLAPHVRYIGGVPDVADYLAAADIGVLASHEEGFSNAVLEGMAAGLPMVVTDVGGNAEAVVDGDCGRVVPARAPEALAAAVLELALSAELRSRYGMRARERVRQRFSEQRCVQLYLDLYSNLARGMDPAIPLDAVFDGH